MDLETALAWYVQLASRPGWNEYVWHRVQEMARDHPVLFADLPARLVAEMKSGYLKPMEAKKK